MHKAILAVWDSAVRAYAQPLTLPTTQVALRSFIDEINRSDATNTLNTHPEDFELHHLADWDETTGQFLNFKDGPICIARAKDHKL
nr:MAG TPA: DNA binding protein [Microviridae sp.]